MNQLNQLILYVSRTAPFLSGLDGHLIRAAMVFTFFAFSWAGPPPSDDGP